MIRLEIRGKEAIQTREAENGRRKQLQSLIYLVICCRGSISELNPVQHFLCANIFSHLSFYFTLACRFLVPSDFSQRGSSGVSTAEVSAMPGSCESSCSALVQYFRAYTCESFCVRICMNRKYSQRSNARWAVPLCCARARLTSSLSCSCVLVGFEVS